MKKIKIHRVVSSGESVFNLPDGSLFKNRKAGAVKATPPTMPLTGVGGHINRSSVV